MTLEEMNTAHSAAVTRMQEMREEKKEAVAVISSVVRYPCGWILVQRRSLLRRQTRLRNESDVQYASLEFRWSSLTNLLIF